MDRSTYSDPAVASLIGRRFVAVRVDADGRPDVNERYNLGGWPTTVFLTSGGDPLSGGTYLDAPQMIAALEQVADAYRDRAGEIARRSASLRDARRLQPVRPSSGPDVSSIVARFRSLLIERVDQSNGGFGIVPSLPHPHALSFALSLSGGGDSELAGIAADTLRRLRALWDADAGGFCRGVDTAGWSHAATEKTLEDNAALLHVYVEAALRVPSAEWRESAAAIVRWARDRMSDRAHGGFFNAESSRGCDKTMYADRNAMMIGAFIRAAALFDDIWLRDFALKSLEAVIVPAYKPGQGIAHVGGEGGGHLRGLLTDQVHTVSALIWAHAATGQLPYSMLAAEVMQFAIRTMWDEAAGRFRDRVESHDPVAPFELNCHAACVLDRLGVLTGDAGYQERARAILHSLEADSRGRDLFGAPYAAAVLEVFDRQPPAGLELSPVEWHLES